MQMMLLVILIGCGSIGLETTYDPSLSSGLEIEPMGTISFGNYDFGGDGGVETMTLFSVGDKDLAIIDIWFGDRTDDEFDFNSDDLPLPLMLAPGENFPLNIAFMPDSVGNYDGEVWVLVDGPSGGQEVSRRLKGQGCDPQSGSSSCQP